MTLTVGDATQRMRWIPPGTFRMGSPEDEPGRWADEGPRHTVTLTHGFWLFDTPCTQQLWDTVMWHNRSRFRSPDRPVETTSWDDAQDFLERLNGRIPGLSLTLPTEAQWEYACRAGTEMALYSGAIAIEGENNAPALDAIAWYGGNSGGGGGDLDDGYDSSRWPEKQHPHTRVGTHPVGRKSPNPWGLYDTLGNVWEWCADGWRDYTADAVTDPRGPETSGAGRVRRGGSWIDDARLVRAAIRRRSDPASSIGFNGFRCASGPA
ncbi:formylglycine-generating enzyme family protein [Azospirillum sp. Sp 7]|uniref:formylglycine-generating enzyme family protein n=1 Tax=Azospirillum sp. Sp 7 TaxID=1685931 RepID=UPI0018C9E2CD|nr:formylglycine-generating enzyme family protein [Azospirillum sp. Sp 7]